MVNFTTYDTVAGMNFSNGTMTVIWAYGNTLTSGLLSPLFMAISFFIIYSMLIFTTSRKEYALTGAAFVMLIEATGFVGSGLMSPFYWLLAFGILVATIYMSSKYQSP